MQVGGTFSHHACTEVRSTLKTCVGHKRKGWGMCMNGVHRSCHQGVLGPTCAVTCVTPGWLTAHRRLREEEQLM